MSLLLGGPLATFLVSRGPRAPVAVRLKPQIPRDLELGGGVLPVARKQTANLGPAITFINRDAVPHRFESAPEIGNGECPEKAQVGTIDPAGTGTVMIDKANYICSFHDGLQPSNLKFKGIIVVH